jgi:hypothetical protein
MVVSTVVNTAGLVLFVIACILIAPYLAAAIPPDVLDDGDDHPDVAYLPGEGLDETRHDFWRAAS